jgi:hypothetical protein
MNEPAHWKMRWTMGTNDLPSAASSTKPREEAGGEGRKERRGESQWELGMGIQKVRGRAVFIWLSVQGRLDLHKTLQLHSELSSLPSSR